MREIVEPILAWYGDHARSLPWRRDREPYHIWISEIMLQQTRAETVRAYYLRFLAELPDVAALARCEEERLFKLWEGLGYYRRVKNLKSAARELLTRYNGIFPGEYEKIRDLPGIGDYTAGAIASICFEIPKAAVDGNVLRIIARINADGDCIDDQAVKRRFARELETVYPAGRAGDFTQALMELGECVCLPKNARCEACPIKAYCAAFAKKAQSRYPVRKAKKPRTLEERSLLLLYAGERIAIQKRASDGLLAELWELPSVDGYIDETAALDRSRAWGLDPLQLEKTLSGVHVFTHKEWHMRCFVIRCKEEGGGFVWASEQELREGYALASAFRTFLADFFLKQTVFRPI